MGSGWYLETFDERQVLYCFTRAAGRFCRGGGAQDLPGVVNNLDIPFSLPFFLFYRQLSSAKRHLLLSALSPFVSLRLDRVLCQLNLLRIVTGIFPFHSNKINANLISNDSK